MANPAADPKSALLADELREYALSLPTSVFPKNFFCATCNHLAIDSFKLLCCNKAICSSCQAKLEFPATCPSCDHSPVEADTCVPNKALRNTMRVWLQKQKKKDEAKAAVKAATPPVEATLAPEVQQTSDADKPVDSIEGVVKSEDGGDQPAEGGGPTIKIEPEGSVSVQGDDPRNDTPGSRRPTEGAEQTPAAEDANGQNNSDGSSFGNNQMMNNGFGFPFNPNQANFNNMAWNGPMNGIPNMMANGNWNGMNPMEFNMNNMNGMPNGMYGFGGNMGMAGMNDMSAMNMMNYGGGFGNGWNGMNGAGFGNFNGYNQMGGYNQSGAYPEMNQFPKNNFQNQNRFHANGGSFPQQRNARNGSVGGTGFQSRPGSSNGPPRKSDGESPDATGDSKVEADLASVSLEGKENIEGADSTSPAQDNETSSGDRSQATEDLSGVTDNDENNAQTGGLNQIQTVDSVEGDSQNFDASMMNNVMPGMPFPGMMNQFPNQMPNMNGPFNANMGPNMGQNMGPNMGYGHNNFGPRGGFNAAYGAATVLTGEPRGVGVEGAPTGPRAMREGRPNTGFSSRANNARFNANRGPSATPAQEAAPTSPRRGRSRSPGRDDSLRTKEKSPSRSQSPAKPREDNERPRSVERDDRRKDRDRSDEPHADDDSERRKDRRHHRSRYDDRDDRGDEQDDRHRDEKEGRDDRARSTSVDSKYRSRSDKEKYRSSRSHRDRSREHRRRHRSRSPNGEKRYEEEEYIGDHHSESGSRRKKDKYRERDRDRSRDRDRDRDRRDRRDRDYDYDREKDRSREKDKERRRRREREEEDEREYDDDRYRSSRRGRKDRERDRDRDRDRDDRDYEKEPSSATSVRPSSPPLNAPTGPSSNNFTIKGMSKDGTKASKPMPPPQPPTGPRGFQPPKGPAADREKDRRDSRDHRRKSSASSIPTTPTTPSAQDHYAAERERNARERDRLDRDSRDALVKNLHARATRPSLSKRNRDDYESSAPEPAQDTQVKVPTGPAAHRDKRRRSGDDNIANLFAAATRKQAGKGGRRGGIKTEGSVERDMERVERDREGRRW